MFNVKSFVTRRYNRTGAGKPTHIHLPVWREVLYRNEVTREWRKLHSVELNEMYSSLSIVRVMKSRMIGACSVYGGEERYIQGFGGET